MSKVGPKEQALRAQREARALDTYALLRSQGVRRPKEYIAGLKAAVSATIAATVTESNLKRNAGRKRVHASGAERQKAYRERRAKG